ncbi:hypothetical protein L3Q67_25750 [Saccharothrix sp. AJ9571]|nr:hypothetical protein L3Q67_25750 [Saccharothrix sp. AJ9571]
MGTRGSVPKRADQRIRRNKDEQPVETVTAAGAVDVPELGFPEPHPMIVDFDESLANSAQAQFYEPSDWQFACFTLHFADRLVKSGKPSSQMRRQAYANDLDEAQALWAVTARSNRSKADQDPAEWLPPYQPSVCRYLTEWVTVKVT